LQVASAPQVVQGLARQIDDLRLKVNAKADAEAQRASMERLSDQLSRLQVCIVRKSIIH
jgi:hypothetical protein